jgi:simple sugar transport system permease protein
VLGGIVAGVLFSALLAYFHLYLGTNIILAGTAFNILASGGTVFLLYMLTGDKGSSSTLASGMVPTINIPFIQDIPFLGTVLSGHNIFVYLAFILAFLINKLIYNTKFGAHLRAVGEEPVAATSVGINVRKTKFQAILISGFLASLGGLNLSMAYLSSFQRDMTAGRGFIALAAVYLGGRKPWGTVLAAIIFGVADALSNQLGTLNIPSQLVQMIPYVITILALVVNGIRSRTKIIEQTRRFQEREFSRVSNEEQK